MVALSIGLLISIMFPAIFTLTLERSSASAEATSGLLCPAIIGGAFVAPVAGAIADGARLAVAFPAPAACYLMLCVFAFAAGRNADVRKMEVASAHEAIRIAPSTLRAAGRRASP